LLVLIAIVTIAIGLAVTLVPDLATGDLLLLIGAVGGVGLAVVAFNRFWWLLLVLFVARASLDVLKPAGGGAGLEAGTIVGIVFLVSAAAWLVVQWRSEKLVPVSGAGLSLLGLAGAYLLSVPGAAVRFTSVQGAMKFVAVAVMFVVLEQIFMRDPEKIRSALAATFLSLVIPAVVALVEVPGAEVATGPGEIGVARVDGTFVHPNMFAAYLVVIALLAVALLPHLPEWRLGLMAVVAASVPLLILTYARGAWIGLYVGLFFIGLAQSRALLLVLFVSTIAVVLLVPSVMSRLSDLDVSREREPAEVDANSAEWRIDYWAEVLPLVRDNPVTGIGAEMIRESTPEEAPAHSAFVDVIVETGILGITMLLLAIGVLGASLVRAGRRLVAGLPRGMAVASVAIALALLLQLFSESLLTQPAVLWYAALPLAWTISASRRVAQGLPVGLPAAADSPSVTSQA
jgi:O-antigen ligase